MLLKGSVFKFQLIEFKAWIMYRSAALALTLNLTLKSTSAKAASGI